MCHLNSFDLQLYVIFLNLCCILIINLSSLKALSFASSKFIQGPIHWISKHLDLGLRSDDVSVEICMLVQSQVHDSSWCLQELACKDWSPNVNPVSVIDCESCFDSWETYVLLSDRRPLIVVASDYPTYLHYSDIIGWVLYLERSDVKIHAWWT